MLANRLVAHRGYQKAYPENTLLAYRQAIKAGALSIETDVLLSADRQAVLYHDPTLKRVSHKKGRIDQHQFEDLLTFPAYEPKRLGERFIEETISPLSGLVDLLLEHPHVTAYIEIKKEAVEFAGLSDTYEAISQCLQPVAEQCPLISFNYDVISYARSQNWPRCGVVLKRWSDLGYDVVKQIKPDIVFCNYKKIPKKAVLNHIKAECGFDFELVLYEIAEPELAIYWLNWGADKVETFDIQNMIQALSQQPEITL